MRTPLLLALVLSAPACGSGGSGPSGPSVRLATFTDPQTGLATSDVHDVDEQIMRFDTQADTLVWATDGSTFPEWSVSGDFLDAQRQFQVRFGSRSGQRHAYFTEAARGTICQLEVRSGQLSISATNVLP